MRVVKQVMRCLVAQILVTITILKNKLKLCSRHTSVKTLDPRLVTLVEHVSWKAFSVKVMVHGKSFKVVKMAVKFCMNVL